jgi:hypothetical protein
VSVSLLVWSHHPLLKDWHSELVVWDKYNDLARTRAEVELEEAEEEAQRIASLTPAQQARLQRRDIRAKRRAAGDEDVSDDSDEDEIEAEEKADAEAIAEAKQAASSSPHPRAAPSPTASTDAAARTYGSGIVGTATAPPSFRRKQGPTTMSQLFREQQAADSQRAKQQ